MSILYKYLPSGTFSIYTVTVGGPWGPKWKYLKSGSATWHIHIDTLKKL